MLSKNRELMEELRKTLQEDIKKQGPEQGRQRFFAEIGETVLGIMNETAHTAKTPGELRQ